MIAYAPDVDARVRADFDPLERMMGYFIEAFGPYPFADYSVVVTADDLEIPLEAQGVAIFGANHADGEGGSERLIAHELAHQWFGNSVGHRGLEAHLAQRGFRLLRRMALVGALGRADRGRAGAPVPRRPAFAAAGHRRRRSRAPP